MLYSLTSLLIWKAALSLHDSLLCKPAVYMLGSHSELNHHFLPNRSQSKQPVGGPDEGIILEKWQPLCHLRLSHMFKLDSISQQVGLSLEGYRILLHASHMGRGVCMCVSMCVPRVEGLLAEAGKKNLV